MGRKNDLRVWGVWDPVISRLEYLSQSFTDCDRIKKLFEKSGRQSLQLLRFDLCPLYRDNSKPKPKIKNRKVRK